MLFVLGRVTKRWTCYVTLNIRHDLEPYDLPKSCNTGPRYFLIFPLCKISLIHREHRPAACLQRSVHEFGRSLGSPEAWKLASQGEATAQEKSDCVVVPMKRVMNIEGSAQEKGAVQVKILEPHTMVGNLVEHRVDIKDPESKRALIAAKPMCGCKRTHF